MIIANKLHVTYMRQSRHGDSWWWFCHETKWRNLTDPHAAALTNCSKTPWNGGYQDGFSLNGGYQSAAEARKGARDHIDTYHLRPAQTAAAIQAGLGTPCTLTWKMLPDRYWTAIIIPTERL